MTLAEVKHPHVKKRRDLRRELGRCINDTNAGTHEPPVAGEARCPSCKATHRKSR